MSRQATVLTDRFLKRIRSAGPLAAAALRVRNSHRHYEPIPDLSTWTLVCEEMVDTEYEPAYYERVVAELFRRGFSVTELEGMRVFAWETAGWLNFERMRWDWCRLDEGDIERAIDWQFHEGEICEVERARRLAYLLQYRSRQPRQSSVRTSPRLTTESVAESKSDSTGVALDTQA